ncbi:hypothetical protein EW146_g2342 [Bondarzewia mesenterica]|uniref:Sm domain-containing protein n=1 Tax=Bondarzewia mesenterica TaxID=1095465 RepID=A0A4S4M156_9AGAM|nr:hypothetical protein EW146_g2342 [Bondarzewia mesenterica]
MKLVELKNGETFNGHLVNCDNFMNITLREVYQTNAEGDRFWKVKECYIRGSTIKYLRVPDTLLDAVKEEQARAREAGKSARGAHISGAGGRGAFNCTPFVGPIHTLSPFFHQLIPFTQRTPLQVVGFQHGEGVVWQEAAQYVDAVGGGGECDDRRLGSRRGVYGMWHHRRKHVSCCMLTFPQTLRYTCIDETSSSLQFRAASLFRPEVNGHNDYAICSMRRLTVYSWGPIESIRMCDPSLRIISSASALQNFTDGELGE